MANLGNLASKAVKEVAKVIKENPKAAVKIAGIGAAAGAGAVIGGKKLADKTGLTDKVSNSKPVKWAREKRIEAKEKKLGIENESEK